MLTIYGLNRFLTALGKPYGARFWVNGGRFEQIYPCDPGYPQLNDPDPTNSNRGTNVLTWRYTISRGTNWGSRPATEVELIDDIDIVDRLTIPDFYTSKDHPTVLYLNMVLRRN